MEQSKKDLIKLRFAICLNKLINKNKEGLSGSEDNIDVVSSLRQLEASSGVSFPIIQLASVAKRDIQLSTAIRLIESLNVKPSEFFELYENLSDAELKKGATEIEMRKNSLSKKIK